MKIQTRTLIQCDAEKKTIEFGVRLKTKYANIVVKLKKKKITTGVNAFTKECLEISIQMNKK